MPPTAKRQFPTDKAPPKNGSLLSQAIDVSELEDDFIKIVIYGQNRVGKTWLSCTFPKPLLLLSFEPNATGGAQTVKLVPGVKLIRVKDSATGAGIADELKSDKTFKTVVLDSATSYQDIFLREILGIATLPEQLDFGGVSPEQYRIRSERIKEALRPFLNLPKHVVITAKEKDHNPPKEERVSASGKKQPDMRPKFLRGMQQESFVASELGGAAVSWLHDACDYICRLYLDKEVIVKQQKTKFNGQETVRETEEETGRIVRRLRTMYHPNFAAGFRSSTPDAVPEHIEEPTFEKIYRVIKGEKP